MIDTVLWCCMALLGIDSITGIWKKFDKGGIKWDILFLMFGYGLKLSTLGYLNRSELKTKNFHQIDAV